MVYRKYNKGLNENGNGRQTTFAFLIFIMYNV